VKTQNRLFTLTVLPFCLILMTPNLGTAEDEAKLSFKPYSSSYLPYRQGYLTQGSRDSSVAGRFDQIREKVFGRSRGRSLYDRLRRPNREGSLLVVDAEGMFNPSRDSRSSDFKEDWEGVCHQWVAASSQPEISELLDQTEAIICDGISLSQGELAELFTAFYRYQAESAVYGRRERVVGNGEVKPEFVSIRNAIKLDDLPAHQFDRELYGHLKAGQPIIMDREPNYQVWNQPIFEAKSTDSEYSESELRENGSGLFASIPLSFLRSTSGSESSEYSLLLKAQARSDLAAMQYINDQNASEDPAHLIPAGDTPETLRRRSLKAIAQARDLLWEGLGARRRSELDPSAQSIYDRELEQQRSRNGVTSSEVLELLALRAVGTSRLKRAFLDGKIGLLPGASVKYRVTRVKYAVETAAGKGGKNAFDTAAYAYFVFDDGRGNTASTWVNRSDRMRTSAIEATKWDLDNKVPLTECSDNPQTKCLALAKRPDFLWTPKVPSWNELKSIAAQGKIVYADALLDLMNLFTSPSCSVQGVSAYYSELMAYSADNRLSASERDALDQNEAQTGIEGLLDPALMSSVVRGSL
jgi:hypothetical protein